MEYLFDFLKVVVPAAIVMYGMFLTIRHVLNTRIEEAKTAAKLEIQSTIVPIRLQAFERIALLLERSSPAQLLARIDASNLTVSQLQHIMIVEVRQEFQHNLAQQIYISPATWTYVEAGIEGVISTINECASQLQPEARSVELVKSIFEKALVKDQIAVALSKLKEEIQYLF